jgi:hypothetical protein
VAKRFLRAYGNAVTWFYGDKNRDEAEALLMKNTGATKDDARQSYDFFRKISYFEPTGKISRKKMNALFEALGQLGETQLPTLDQVVLPGTELTD